MRIEPPRLHRAGWFRSDVRTAEVMKLGRGWVLTFAPPLEDAPMLVQQGVLAHELQHVRHDPPGLRWFAWALMPLVAVPVLAAVVIARSTTGSLQGGLVLLAGLLATTGALLGWVAGAAVFGRADQLPSQVRELRADLLAAGLVGPEAVVDGLVFLRAAIPPNESRRGSRASHPWILDRITAVRRFGDGRTEPLMFACQFLLHDADRTLVGTDRRRAERVLDQV